MKSNKLKQIVNFILLIAGCILLITLWITKLFTSDNFLLNKKAFFYLGVWTIIVFIIIYLVRKYKINKRPPS